MSIELAKQEAQHWAETIVEDEVIDGLADANLAARLDIVERMGANPQLPGNNAEYVDVFVKVFESEFRKLYASAYAHQYRKAYRKHFKREQQLQVVA